MSLQSKQLGNRGESLASQYLQKRGLKVLSRNLRTKFGEVDILARDGQTVLVVEVKTKTSDRFGSALEMITPAKQRKLILLCHYLMQTYQTTNARVDIITIDEAANQPKVRYYKGIVEFNG